MKILLGLGALVVLSSSSLRAQTACAPGLPVRTQDTIFTRSGTAFDSVYRLTLDSTLTCTLRSRNQPPVAVGTAVCPSWTCQFSALQSTDDAPGLTYAWYALTGTVPLSTSATFSRPFTTTQPRKFRLVVTDVGGLSDVDTVPFTPVSPTVPPPAPPPAPPPPPPIGSTVVRVWIEPAVTAVTDSTGKIILWYETGGTPALADSLELCAFFQFSDSAIGMGVGGKQGTCLFRLRAHEARTTKTASLAQQVWLDMHPPVLSAVLACPVPLPVCYGRVRAVGAGAWRMFVWPE